MTSLEPTWSGSDAPPVSLDELNRLKEKLPPIYEWVAAHPNPPYTLAMLRDVFNPLGPLLPEEAQYFRVPVIYFTAVKWRRGDGLTVWRWMYTDSPILMDPLG